MGGVGYILFDNIEHPARHWVIEYLGRLRLEGMPYTLREKRFIVHLLLPLFDFTSVRRVDVLERLERRMYEAKRLVQERKWSSECTRFYGGQGGVENYNSIKHFLSQRAGVLRYRDEYRNIGNDDIKRMLKAAELVAAFAILPEDIEKIDALDWSLPAPRRGAHG